MAKGIGPLLLIAGAAALLLATKKKGAADGTGMRMIGICEGVEIVDMGDAWEHMTRSLSAVMDAGGVDPDDLYGISDADLEEYVALVYFRTFSECEWPPVNPDEFMVGAVSWTSMMDKLMDAFHKLGAGTVQTVSTGGTLSRAKKTHLLTKVIIGG